MSRADLMNLAEAGDIASFETRCLELLENGKVPLGELASPFQRLQAKGKGDRIVALAEMVLEAAGPEADPHAALKLARVAAEVDPTNSDLRQRLSALYERAYGKTPGFATILEAAGLNAGRPLRNALRTLEMGLLVEPSATLLSRTDGHAVEVTEVDRENGLFTLRHEGRAATLPTAELVREYERVDKNDFRVLKQLWPDRLTHLIESDPVALVIGMLRAHGDQMDVDSLKHELCPRYLPAKEWTRWFANARTQLKRSPHVIIEGRAPVILRYSAEGQSLEDETMTTFEGQKEPVEWLDTIESYLREKTKWKETPDSSMLQRVQKRIGDHIEIVRQRRPAEALACALIMEKLSEMGLPHDARTSGLAQRMLGDIHDPTLLIRALEHDLLWERAFEALHGARAHDAVKHMIELFPHASAGLLDRIVRAVRVGGGPLAVLQIHIDAAMNDPLNYPEILYWLWKGPDNPEGLSLPSARELLTKILDTLAALGRTLNPPTDVLKRFRARMKSALALRDYAQVRVVLGQISDGQAVTVRGQLERLDGLGENARVAMVDILRTIHPLLWVKPQKRIEPWEDETTLWCTEAGLRRRTEERDDIVNVQMRDNARRIGEAASYGDLSENSEYKFALEERDLLRARLAQVNNELSIARTLSPDVVPTTHVGIGSRVTMRDVATGQERIVTFLSPFETNVEAGVLNYRAPFSLKLMGLHVGDRATMPVNGKDVEYEILSLANGLTS